MLEQIKISKTFNHKNTVLDLHSGVTIISGASHSGKSSAFLSIENVLSNSLGPYTSFKPWTAKKKDISETELIFDDGSVKRSRNDTINEYSLSFKSEPYTAFGQSVPDDIIDFINFDEFNFQSQHMPYFFIAETPPERARMLNKISGLEIIDKSQSKIDSIISGIRNKIKAATENIKNADEEIKTYENLDHSIKLVENIEELILKEENLYNEKEGLKLFTYAIGNFESRSAELKTFISAEVPAQKIKELIDQKEILESERKYLTNWVENVIVLENEIEKNKKIVCFEEEIIELKRLFNEKNDLEISIKKLEKISSNISDLEGRKEILVSWLEVENHIEEFNELVSQYVEIENETLFLNDFIEEVGKAEQSVIDSRERLDVLKKERIELMVEIDICPFCKRKL